MKKPIVVHLGNIGEFKAGEKTAERTIHFGQRRPLMGFVGIDLHQVKKEDRKGFPKNVKQKKADFLKGLNGLRDNSVYGIRSEMSVGHFDQAGKDLKGYQEGFFGRYLTETPEQMTTYTTKIINAVYRKLMPGGKLKLVVAENVLEFVKKAIKTSHFRPENVKIVKLASASTTKRGTYWQKQYKSYGNKIYRIIVTK